MSFYVRVVRRVKVNPLHHNTFSDFRKIFQIAFIPMKFVIKCYQATELPRITTRPST